VLREVQELQLDLQRRESIRIQLVKGHEQLATFGQGLQQWREHLPESQQALPSVPLLEWLLQELAQAETHERLRVQQLVEASDTDRKRHDLDLHREQLANRLQETCTAAGLSCDADLTSTLAAFELRRELDQQLREVELLLQPLGGGSHHLQDELAGAEPHALQTQQLDLQDRLQELEEQRRQELERVGALRKQLHDWTTTNPAQQQATHLEGLKAELVQGVERWAPLALAETMMQRALQRFEEHHQPRLLLEVGRWLKRLTRGRYVQLQQSLQEPGVIRIVDEHGKARTPDELSTGTREQLFLAMRLAYVTDYSLRHDPLPMVLDDVLVNFDEDRARETLQALVEFSEVAQVIVLTCHRRTVELAQSVSDGIGILELSPGSLARAESESHNPVGSDPRRRRIRSSTPPQPALFPMSGGEGGESD
jgi:uncharacterized protein YhaN